MQKGDKLQVRLFSEYRDDSIGRQNLEYIGYFFDKDYRCTMSITHTCHTFLSNEIFDAAQLISNQGITKFWFLSFQSYFPFIPLKGVKKCFNFKLRKRRSYTRKLKSKRNV